MNLPTDLIQAIQQDMMIGGSQILYVYFSYICIMKRSIFKATVFTALIAVTGISVAKTIVVHDTDGMPVIAASVMNHKGVNITLTDNQGHVTINETDYPLTIKSLGLYDTQVQADADTVVMSWRPMEMEEVVVSSQTRPMARIICYICETSGMIADGDTTQMEREGMVDFIIPVAKAKMKGRDYPRLLNSRYTVTSTIEDVDSSEIVEAMSFFHIVSYPRKDIQESKSLADLSAGTDTVKVTKKGELMELHSKTPAGYRIHRDFLADKKNHNWSPWFLKLMGFTIDVDELTLTYLYGSGRDGLHKPLDLQAMTATFHMLGRGKWIRKAFGTQGNVNINTHIELIPVDISFLSEQEAKEIDKEQPKQEFILPPVLE